MSRVWTSNYNLKGFHGFQYQAHCVISDVQGTTIGCSRMNKAVLALYCINSRMGVHRVEPVIVYKDGWHDSLPKVKQTNKNIFDHPLVAGWCLLLHASRGTMGHSKVKVQIKNIWFMFLLFDVRQTKRLYGQKLNGVTTGWKMRRIVLLTSVSWTILDEGKTMFQYWTARLWLFPGNHRYQQGS